MTVMPMISPAGTSTSVRCECARCGAHVMVRRSWQLSGMCGNCRSYDLRPLASPPGPPNSDPADGADRARPLPTDLPLPARVAMGERRAA